MTISEVIERFGALEMAVNSLVLKNNKLEEEIKEQLETVSKVNDIISTFDDLHKLKAEHQKAFLEIEKALNSLNLEQKNITFENVELDYSKLTNELINGTKDIISKEIDYQIRIKK